MALDLHAEELGVASAAGEELVVGAGLDHPPILDHDDLVGVADGAEAVGDDEAGAPPHEAGEGALDEVLDELDTPFERARLARAVIAARDAGRCGRLLAAVALIDLGSGSRQLLCASVIQAVAVRAGVARTPAGILLAA